MISNSALSVEGAKNMGSVYNSIVQVSIRGGKEAHSNLQSLSRENSNVLSLNNPKLSAPHQNHLLRNLSKERLEIEDGEKMEP